MSKQRYPKKIRCKKHKESDLINDLLHYKSVKDKEGELKA